MPNKKKSPARSLLQDATNQDSGVGEFAGSLDDMISDVRSAWYASGILPMSEILAVFPDYLLIHQTGNINDAGSQYSYGGGYSYEDYDSPIRYDPCDICWKFNFTYDDSCDAVEFLEGIQCTLTTVVSEMASMDDSGGDPEGYQDAFTASQDDAPTYAVPSGIQKSTTRALTLSDKHGYKGTTFTSGLAQKLSTGTALTERDMRQAVKFFEKNAGVPREQGDKIKPPSKQYMKWMQCGGDAAHQSFTRQLGKIDKAKLKQADAIKNPVTSLDQGLEQKLTQTFSVLLQKKTGEVGKVMNVDGIATIANIINSKNQAYPRDIWEGTWEHMEELIGQSMMLGECEHPKDGRTSLDRTIMKFNSIQWQGDEVQFNADILPTIPHGHNVQVMIEAEIPVNMSSRGQGKTKKMDWLGQSGVDVVQPGFVCDGFDAVVGGASTGSEIKSYRINQSAAPDASQEETMDPETLQLIKDMAAGVQALKQSNEETATRLAALEQSGTPAAVPATEIPAAAEPAVLQQSRELDDDTKALIQERAVERRERIETKAQRLVQDAATKMKPEMVAVYNKHVERILKDEATINVQVFDDKMIRVEEMMQDMFTAAGGPGSPAANPGMGHVWIQASKESTGCKTPNEMIERLIEHLPDVGPDGVDPMDKMWSMINQDDGSTMIAADCVRTPRRQARKILQNMASMKVRGADGNFNGPREMNTLCLMSQGKRSEAENYLNQSVPDGATAVGAGGAPTTSAYIFPLFTYLYPMLFTNEISSTQPMDKPDGRIFYKRSYRITPGKNWTDENGQLIVDRTPTDLEGGAIDPTYANDPGEFEQTRRIQLRLASRSVTAESKKLSDEASIEEIMDLQAYHNIDAMQELMQDLVLEIAQEFNAEVLADLLAATQVDPNNPRALVYNTDTPSGYTNESWQRYLGRYVASASNQLYKSRNGEMTHVIAGPDAWFALESAMALGALPNDANGANPRMYSGLIFTPLADPVFSGVKTFKTNLWSGVNRNKILILRRGTAWNDTPHVWAPYAQYTSPILTVPDTMSQTQGYMDRSAHVVVASSAIASITIQPGAGQPIAFPTAS